jgi:hypothetical protein
VLRDQVIEARRQRPVHLLAVKKDRARVLLAPKNELRFALANGLVLPGRQEGGHPHSRNRNSNQQGD